MTDAVKDALLAENPILEYFEFEHLPPHLRATSQPFHTLAWTLAEIMPRTAEKSAGLRKLLEAKDCFVRCSVTKNRTDNK